MKRIAALLLIVAIFGCSVDLQAQTKKKLTKKPVATKPKPVEVPLPENSNDCLFAIELQPDIVFGPTEAPQGGGRIQDVMADKNNPYVFDYEHNSCWFKFTVPYSGNFQLTITPTNHLDDYDFCIFKYTDAYFSNRLIEGKIKPIASNLSNVDTSSKTGIIGMMPDGTKTFITKKMVDANVKSIAVKKGEVYYIALDNRTGTGGFSIVAGIQVESFEPMIRFYDPTLKKNVEVDLLILEKNTDNRPIIKNPKFRGGHVKFVPGFNYTLYAKADGYFSVYKEFNSNIFKDDTIMRFNLNRTVKGSTFSLSDVYFDDEGQLLPESHSTLEPYITMFRNHNDLTFQIKGFVPSYGVDIERDQQLSLKRAQSVRQYFIENGIAESRMTVAGMTQNEIKRSAAAALNKGQAFSQTKVEIIITGMGSEQ